MCTLQQHEKQCMWVRDDGDCWYTTARAIKLTSLFLTHTHSTQRWSGKATIIFFTQPDCAHKFPFIHLTSNMRRPRSIIIVVFHFSSIGLYSKVLFVTSDLMRRNVCTFNTLSAIKAAKTVNESLNNTMYIVGISIRRSIQFRSKHTSVFFFLVFVFIPSNKQQIWVVNESTVNLLCSHIARPAMIYCQCQCECARSRTICNLYERL